MLTNQSGISNFLTELGEDDDEGEEEIFAEGDDFGVLENSINLDMLGVVGGVNGAKLLPLLLSVLLWLVFSPTGDEVVLVSLLLFFMKASSWPSSSSSLITIRFLLGLAIMLTDSSSSSWPCFLELLLLLLVPLLGVSMSICMLTWLSILFGGKGVLMEGYCFILVSVFSPLFPFSFSFFEEDEDEGEEEGEGEDVMVFAVVVMVEEKKERRFF